jgi:S-formylglutathione hydrolase FrmB
VQVRPGRAAKIVLVAAAAGVVAAAGIGWGGGTVPAAWPQAVDLSYGSDALKDEIGLRVYLPPDYARTTGRYPVVYFLHGLPASADAYKSTTFLRVAMASLDRDAIVVAVQGARDGEPDTEYLNSGPGHNWETAVAAEVPRLVDARFRTIRSRAGRAIVGVSAGGYGAMLVGLHHLGEYSVIESWSGYFHPTDATGTVPLDLGSSAKNRNASAHSFVGSLRQAFAGKPTYLAFYVGTGDKRFRPENVQFDRELTAARVPHLFRIYPGAHTQALWNAHAVAWLHLALVHLAAAG